VITATVRDVVRATPRTRILRLDLGSAAFAFTAGQAVLVGRAGAATRAPYSIASPPSMAERGALELLTPADGAFGELGVDPAQLVGTALELQGPLGTFGVPEADGDAPLVLVAGGTGIAPLRSVAFDVVEHQPRRSMAIVYSARAADEFAFGDDLQRLEDQGRIALHKTVTRDEATDWPGRTGRIDAHLLTSLVPGADAWWLVCGPAPFVSEVRAALGRIGVDGARVVVER
jgi:ferredoxin-NADP reductase